MLIDPKPALHWQNGTSALLHLNVAAAVHCVLSARTWKVGTSPALVAPHVVALHAGKTQPGWTHQPFPLQSGMETNPQLEHSMRSKAEVMIEGQEGIQTDIFARHAPRQLKTPRDFFVIGSKGQILVFAAALIFC
jgi:hypothetical protein